MNEHNDKTLEKGELYVKIDLVKFTQFINTTKFFLDKLVNQIDMSVLRETGKRLEKRNKVYGRREYDRRKDESRKERTTENGS